LKTCTFKVDFPPGSLRIYQHQHRFTSTFCKLN